MHLIVGLGNPGKEYENTRHNVGFMVIDKYANKNNITNYKEKFNGYYFEKTINGEKVIFLKPLKYMNLSGEVVKKYVDFFKININDILVISDDLDMETGRIKIKLKGSSGGHNGLKNIEHHLQTQEYKRIKVGIANNKKIDTKDYVLGAFYGEEKDKINEATEKTINIIEDYFKLNFDNLMNKYN